MTAKAALCYHLLKGDVLTVGTAFRIIGITNISREIGRNIERRSGKGNAGFGVTVSRLRKEGKNRYKSYATWNEYRLNLTGYNAAGVKRMKEYLKKQAKGHPDENKFLSVCK